MGTGFEFGILAQGLSLTHIDVAVFALPSLPSLYISKLMPHIISSQSAEGIHFGVGATELAMHKAALIVFQGFFQTLQLLTYSQKKV